MFRRLLLLTTANSYRAGPFLAAAERLGVDVVRGVDAPAALSGNWPGALPLDFADPDGATKAIVEYAADHPLAAIMAVDDSGGLLAAQASAALDLPHNDPEAAVAARDKHVMRQMVKRGGLPVPAFRLCSTGHDVAALAQEVDYPCVVKPLQLSGSRGVIRTDDAETFVAAVGRLRRILGDGPRPFLVEAFIPGFEVALEGLLDDGRLHVLALFDKPDPLDGPFFEETIYVTPSRLPTAVQSAIARTTAQAARALGLRVGPVHAELRVNDDGPWIVELAGRSIGGLCSQTLTFGVDVSLEELILRQALGMDLQLERTPEARGVMMIPIPTGGLLRGVSGLEAACATPGVEEVTITAGLNQEVTPLPEGESYLGFIFARGQSPDDVEAALRRAHGQLAFEIEPIIRLRNANFGRYPEPAERLQNTSG